MEIVFSPASGSPKSPEGHKVLERYTPTTLLVRPASSPWRKLLWKQDPLKGSRSSMEIHEMWGVEICWPEYRTVISGSRLRRRGVCHHRICSMEDTQQNETCPVCLDTVDPTLGACSALDCSQCGRTTYHEDCLESFLRRNG